MTDSLLPPLPKIDGDIDLMLDVYTHDTLRGSETILNNDYGDTARLRELGQQVLNFVVTFHLVSQRPMLTQQEIQAERDRYTSDENLDLWVNSYGLKEKLRVAPNEATAVMHNPKEMANFFHVYVGALYIRNGGLPVVQNWISRLITPNSPDLLPNPSLAPVSDGAYNPQSQYMQQPHMQQPHMQHQHMQHQHYMQQQHMPSSSPYSTPVQHNGYSPQGPPSQLWSGSPGMGTPPPPAHNPPPLPSGPGHMSSPLSLVTLALVNQTASQKGFQVTYPAEQAGPPHLPTWTVRCCINGAERGLGVGKSQKLAKEEAARQAWAAMGWGPT